MRRIREEVRETVAQAGSGDADRVRAELGRLASELDAHFTREEDTLLAALNAL
jgi:hypothetical protein